MWRGTTVPRDRRPVIAHAQLVDDADIGRFAELGVIPNMQPLWAQLDALMTVLTVPRLGAERADKQYRIRSIEESGAPLAFGSDWPVSSGAPLDGIAVAVSRQTADGEPEGGWTPDEILPIERALSAYTAGVAYQAFAEDDWGRLDPGASADLVWLDRDPRTTPAAGTSRAQRSCHVSARQAGLLGHRLEERTICRQQRPPTPPCHRRRRRRKATSSACSARRRWCCSAWSTWCRSRCSPPTASSPQTTGGRLSVAYLVTLAAMVFTARSYARMAAAYPGGRLGIHLHAEVVRRADRLPGRLVAAAGLPVPADAQLPRHRHLPERRDPGRFRRG